MTQQNGKPTLSRRRFLGAGLAVAAGAAAPGLARAASDSGIVTIYSADGLRDGHPNWYQTQFNAFTRATGIRVQYIEAGSGVIVNRIARERANTQADVLVTLPPFIQRAASLGLLQPFKPSASGAIPADSKDEQGHWYAMINNYLCFIYNSHVLKQTPASYAALLNPRFKNKLQYSTPGQAGDGTAVMLQAFHVFGNRKAGFEYLRKLQANNLGPSSSTGKLTALVNKGEIWVANGDLQMNFAQQKANPYISIFWPAGPDGVSSSFSLPYAVGLVSNAPNADNGRKLINFLLARKAQEQVSSIAGGLPARTDIDPTDNNYQQLNQLMSGVKIWTPDWNDVLKNLKDDVARWHRVTNS